MRLGDRLPDRAEPLALDGGHVQDRREAQEREALLDRALQRLLLVVVDRVPLVDGQHHGTAAFQDVAGDVRVLVGDALRGVEQQEDDVRIGDRLQRLDDRELLDRLEDPALLAQPGGVDELELLPGTLERHGDRVPRRAGLIEGNQALLAQPGIDQGRLADIGPAGNRQPDRLGGVVRFVGLGLRREVGQRRFHQAAHAFAVRRGHRMRLAEPEFVELAQARGFGHALGLVRRQHDAPARRAEVARNVVVLRGEPGADIDQEDHCIGLSHGLPGLLGHLLDDARGAVGLEAAGVDHDELEVALARVAVVTVAGQAREVGDDGVPALGDAIEEG